MNSQQIPQLDIQRFETDRDSFVTDFGNAYQEWGFAGITGHGIDARVIQAALDSAADFFALPLTIKEQYLGSGDWSRGYVPFGKEKAKDSKHADLKEFYHIGRELEESPSSTRNRWPKEVAHFKHSVQSLYSALDSLGQTLLQVVALHLGLEDDYFADSVNHGEALLRILHYPPLLDSNAPNVRAAAHEDINLLTLLVGSEQAGLEVLSRQGEWVPISIIEGTIICNVGDMLQRITNRQLPSTTHRVVNPKGADAKTSRYSIPFFIHPHPEMRLDCLPQCVDEDHPRAFEPCSAGEYHEQRLREIGLLT